VTPAAFAFAIGFAMPPLAVVLWPLAAWLWYRDSHFLSRHD
jgi:hypothetical protein